MGSLLSLFRSKGNTITLLDKIQNDIEDIEEFKYSTSKEEKNCICLLCLVFTILYLIAATVVFFFYEWVPLTSWLVLIDLRFWSRISPFIVFPIIFYLIKRGLHFYFIWTRDKNEKRLRDLKKQKKKILERVRETETYNIAEEILKKYDPNSIKKVNVQQPLTYNSLQTMTPIGSQLRYRGNTTPMPRPMPAITSGSTIPAYTPQTGSAFRPRMPVGGTTRGPMMTPMSPQLIAPPIRTVKPIVSQSRSIVEKVVDYMVGDGPNNRYALICVHCYSHNGMALKEEFEYIAFRCCYCKGFNAARKMRPQPPRLGSIDNRRSSSSSSLVPLIDEPESDTDSDRGRKSVENSTRISEIPNQSDNERPVDNQSENESKKETKETTEADESVVNSDSNNTLASGTENDVQRKDSESETNKESPKEIDIPFMDDSNDSSLS